MQVSHFFVTVTFLNTILQICTPAKVIPLFKYQLVHKNFQIVAYQISKKQVYYYTIIMKCPNDYS